MNKRNNIYSDIERTLKTERSGNLRVEYDADAVIQSIKNIFSTIKGERVRSPIGSSLLSYLFEPMTPDTEDDIKAEITRNIRQYEPRVDRLKVNVIGDRDNRLYKITLEFTISRFTRPFRFQTNLRAMGED